MLKVSSSKPKPLSQADVERMRVLKKELFSGLGRDGIANYEEKKDELEGLEARSRESGFDINVSQEGMR